MFISDIKINGNVISVILIRTVTTVPFNIQTDCNGKKGVGVEGGGQV